MWQREMDTMTARDGEDFDVYRVREDFPILQRPVRGKPLVYLDSAASTHKPRVVIDALSRFYSEDYSNVHRGVHYLSQRATDLYEDARRVVRDFLHAEHAFLPGETAEEEL